MILRYDLLFEQWKASLAERDRKTPAIQGNFEDLFQTFKDEGLDLEGAYAFLPRAIKAHSPTSSLVKTIWKKMKATNYKYASEKEFEESWVQDIADRANIAFFNIYPMPVKKHDEEEPVVYGNMTAKEYKAQREHADAYPRFDTEELEKTLRSSYDPMKDFESLLGKDNSGNSK